MPTALAGALIPLFANSTLVSIFGFAGVANLALGAAYLAIGAAAYIVSLAFQPPKPEAPKPDDGKFNLKQSVPPLTYVLGRVKKGGDYAFLEERGGTAYHVTVHAAHSIEGFGLHYLHDEAIDLSGTTVTNPGRLNGKVTIDTRLGADASTAYGTLISVFPEIWTADHRGDGLATVMMSVASVAAEDQMDTYPQSMPQHSAVILGHNRLIDPRTGVAGYSTNIPVFRYWHLTHPVGGKLTTDDLYTPEWANAAGVADEAVTNRQGGTLSRYHGGFWFRANNDPVQIGRLMDQAADMVIYERADGKIGVHAGEFVEPDIRLTADDLISVHFDANKRKATNVLAVRGRYTDKTKLFNTADAAIYGLPYPTDDERTKTVENQIVQEHNHSARLQKLAFLRARAPRVNLVSHYRPARNVPYRRFITVHFPPKLSEAVIEIVGRPKLSLRNQTYTFEGLVLSGSLYAFDAATEEGLPGAAVDAIAREDVPAPEGFDVAIEDEGEARFALATVDFQNDAFVYELEWVPTAGGALQSVRSTTDTTEMRTGALAVGVEYKFRARTWSAGSHSAWTTYETRTVTGDTTPPASPTLLGLDEDAGDVAAEVIQPNDARAFSLRVWRAPTGDAFGTATDVSGQVLAGPNQGLLIVDPAPGAGSWDYWVTSESAGGYASAPAGPETIVVP